MKTKSKKWLSIAVSLVTVLILSAFFVGGAAANSSSCPPSLLDSVNIGDTTSEAGHNPQGWTNIWTYGPYSVPSRQGDWCDNPAGSPPGGDGSMQLIWGDSGELSTLSYNWASVDLNAGCKTALSLKVRHLAGAADDGFNAYVNDTHVGTFVDTVGSNTWMVDTFDISSLNLSGTFTVKFVATGPAWSGIATYGQVAFSWIELYGADTTPPTISVSVSPNTLWPPGHKMVDITATVTVNDNCDASPTVVLTSIVSNEPDDAVGDGDGNTLNDVQGAVTGTDDRSFSLRAERAGGGTGRIYTITYTATDACGNSASVSATVTVPHDQD